MKIRLTKKDKENMWGGTGPYSEVNLSEQSRLMDNTISRIFLVIEAKINPFTFEFVLKNREELAGDTDVQDLLDHAEYFGPIDGYVVSGGEEELIDKKSFELAFQYRLSVIKTVLKMHEFVMRKLDIKSKGNGIKITDPVSSNDKYVWDSSTGSVRPAKESIWGSDTYVDSPAGIKNGKIRYFVVLALASGIALTRNEVRISATATKKTADKMKVDIESAEANSGYIMLTVLIGPDVPPAEFIEQCIAGSNAKKKLFEEDYYTTNVSRPTWQEIEGFLRSLGKRPRRTKR